MKKQILACSILLTSFALHAQKHVKGINEIGAGGGKTDRGFYGEVGYHKILSSTFKLGSSLIFEKGKEKTITFTSVYLQPEVRYAPIDIGENFYLNFGAGLVLNYTSVNLSQTVEGVKNPKGLNYGAVLLIEPEYYLSEKILIYANVRRYFMMDKINGTGILMGGLGLKYSF